MKYLKYFSSECLKSTLRSLADARRQQWSVACCKRRLIPPPPHICVQLLSASAFFESGFIFPGPPCGLSWPAQVGISRVKVTFWLKHCLAEKRTRNTGCKIERAAKSYLIRMLLRRGILRYLKWADCTTKRTVKNYRLIFQASIDSPRTMYLFCVLYVALLEDFLISPP